MYKINLGWLPDIFEEFTRNHDIHDHNTRQHDHFHLPKWKLNSAKMSVYYQGPKIWNTISSNINIDCSIGVFKTSLKKYICMNPISL